MKHRTYSGLILPVILLSAALLLTLANCGGDDKEVILGNTAAAISAGGKQTCAIVNDGTAKCWGNNEYGQLGNGDRLLPSSTPVDVTGLGSGVSWISTGNTHICAVQNGTGKCWGDNTHGKLGDGTNTESRSAPVDVVDSDDNILTGVIAISAGTLHTCAVVGGGAKCWGNNQSGQLGNGTVTTYGSDGRIDEDNNSPAPVDVVDSDGNPLTGVTAIAAGLNHTCAMIRVNVNDGSVKCWGANLSGALGNGGFPVIPDSDPPTNLVHSTPMDVMGLGNGVTAISIGSSHTCAIQGGKARCWGDNTDGKLGNGMVTTIGDDQNRSAPVDVVDSDGNPLTGVTAIAAGPNHTCAVHNAAAKCWGNNLDGKLGNGNTIASATPVEVSGLGNVVRLISAGDSHTCAVAGRAVRCWGHNSNGELGNGNTRNHPTPVSVSGF